LATEARRHREKGKEARKQGGKETGKRNAHFVSTRKLEVIEMGRVVRIVTRGVSIRRVVASE
jgi:hypothetical protein